MERQRHSQSVGYVSDIKKERKMRNIIFGIIVFFLMAGQVCADIFVLYDKNTNEIVNISEKDNFFINENNLAVKILPKDFAFYALDKEPFFYKLSGNDIILNTKKLSDKQAKEDKEKTDDDQRLIDRELAKDKLMALGLTSDEFEAIAK